MAKELTAFRQKVFRTNRTDVTLRVTLEPIGPDFLQLRARVGNRAGNRLSRSIWSTAISATGQVMGYVAVLCPTHGQESVPEAVAHGCQAAPSAYRGD